MDDPITEIYVVVVEQDFANYFYLDKWFKNKDDAFDYAANNDDRVVYRARVTDASQGKVELIGRIATRDRLARSTEN